MGAVERDRATRVEACRLRSLSRATPGLYPDATKTSSIGSTATAVGHSASRNRATSRQHARVRQPSGGGHPARKVRLVSVAAADTTLQTSPATQAPLDMAQALNHSTLQVTAGYTQPSGTRRKTDARGSSVSSRIPDYAPIVMHGYEYSTLRREAVRWFRP